MDTLRVRNNYTKSKRTYVTKSCSYGMADLSKSKSQAAIVNGKLAVCAVICRNWMKRHRLPK